MGSINPNKNSVNIAIQISKDTLHANTINNHILISLLLVHTDLQNNMFMYKATNSATRTGSIIQHKQLHDRCCLVPANNTNTLH